MISADMDYLKTNNTSENIIFQRYLILFSNHAMKMSRLAVSTANKMQISK